MNPVLIGLSFLAFIGAFYALQRKMALMSRWEHSIQKAVRDWDVAAALDAKEAVGEEFIWTLLLIILWVGAILLFLAGLPK